MTFHSVFTIIHALYRSVFRILSNIYDGAFLLKQLTAKSRSLFFAKKLHHRCLTGSEIHLCCDRSFKTRISYQRFQTLNKYSLKSQASTTIKFFLLQVSQKLQFYSSVAHGRQKLLRDQQKNRGLDFEYSSDAMQCALGLFSTGPWSLETLGL